jgi:hypothetical protein
MRLAYMVVVSGITSWQTAADPQDLSQPVFSRDLLQVEVLREDRTRHLFTIFVNHLKSHFVPFDVDDPAAEAKRANELRKRQCEVAAQIIETQMRPNSAFLVVGDMNDPPGSEFLAPLAQSSRLNLVSGLSNAKETRPGPGNPPPPTTAWTERFKESGKPAEYTLMDQVWLSPALAPKLKEAFIERRTKLGGNGSDHDPSWVVLEM